MKVQEAGKTELEHPQVGIHLLARSLRYYIIYPDFTRLRAVC